MYEKIMLFIVFYVMFSIIVIFLSWKFLIPWMEKRRRKCIEKFIHKMIDEQIADMTKAKDYNSKNDMKDSYTE